MRRNILAILLWTACQLHGSVQLIGFPSEIGTRCLEDDRCNEFIEHSICKDYVCACAQDFVPHPLNKSSCISVAKNLNDPCEEQIQCTITFGPNGTCSEEKKCICKPGNHFIIPSKCVLNIGLGETCEGTFQCYLPQDGLSQHIKCDDDKKQCSCDMGYVPTPDKQRCESSGATNIISIVCLIGVWILHLEV